jgi:lipid-binding SYLF domain-containing protein
MLSTLTRASILAAALFALPACSTAPSSESGKAELHTEVQSALERFKKHDPSLDAFLGKSYGYAIFPEVAKGAVGVGGAYGKGEVYEQGKLVGYCDLSQGTIGLQLGGQSYCELIAFENKAALDHFKSGNAEFSANASAVAASAGAAAKADYANGVAVFTMTNTGLMFEASIGGQGFSFKPL